MDTCVLNSDVSASGKCPSYGRIKMLMKAFVMVGLECLMKAFAMVGLKCLSKLLSWSD